MEQEDRLLLQVIYEFMDLYNISNNQLSDVLETDASTIRKWKLNRSITPSILKSEKGFRKLYDYFVEVSSEESKGNRLINNQVMNKIKCFIEFIIKSFKLMVKKKYFNFIQKKKKIGIKFFILQYLY